MKANPEATIIFTVEGKDYSLDCSQFSVRECSVIKRYGNIRGLAEIESSLLAGDIELIAALAVVAMSRAGVRVNPSTFLDGDINDKITVRPSDEADPTDAPTTGQTNLTDTPPACNGDPS